MEFFLSAHRAGSPSYLAALNIFQTHEVSFEQLLSWTDDKLSLFLSSDPVIEESYVAELIKSRRAIRAPIKATWNGDTRKMRVVPIFSELLSAIAKSFTLKDVPELTYIDNDSDTMTTNDRDDDVDDGYGDDGDGDDDDDEEEDDIDDNDDADKNNTTQTRP